MGFDKDCGDDGDDDNLIGGRLGNTTGYSAWDWDTTGYSAEDLNESKRMSKMFMSKRMSKIYECVHVGEKILYTSVKCWMYPEL